MTKLWKIVVRVPASFANAGPAYDVIAIAIDLLNQFEIYALQQHREPHQPEFDEQLDGEYGNSDTLDINLFASGIRKTLNHFRREAKDGNKLPDVPMFIRQIVRIPPKRGLGSSGSAAIAAVIVATCYYETLHPAGAKAKIGKYTPREIREDISLCSTYAMWIDTCPDNVGASHSGGLTAAMLIDAEYPRNIEMGRVKVYGQTLDDDDLRIVALVPDQPIDTANARKLLEDQQPSFQNAQFNLGRATVLPMVLQQRDYGQLRYALEDRLHQRIRASRAYRSPLPEGKLRVPDNLNLEEIIRDLLTAGAYGACIGGAGSTLIAFSSAQQAAKVESAFKASYRKYAPAGWGLDKTLIKKVRNTGYELEDPSLVSVSETPAKVQTWANKFDGGRPLKSPRRPRGGPPRPPRN